MRRPRSLLKSDVADSRVGSRRFPPDERNSGLSQPVEIRGRGSDSREAAGLSKPPSTKVFGLPFYQRLCISASVRAKEPSLRTRCSPSCATNSAPIWSSRSGIQNRMLRDHPTTSVGAFHATVGYRERRSSRESKGTSLAPHALVGTPRWARIMRSKDRIRNASRTIRPNGSEGCHRPP
jgi:hypothetical protein